MKYAFYANLVCVILIVAFGVIQNKNCFAIRAADTGVTANAEQEAAKMKLTATSGQIIYTNRTDLINTKNGNRIFADNLQYPVK